MKCTSRDCANDAIKGSNYCKPCRDLRQATSRGGTHRHGDFEEKSVRWHRGTDVIGNRSSDPKPRKK